MRDADRRLTPREVGAFGIGLAVTIASAVLASPFPFPVNFLIGFGLGGTAYYAARKVLDPRTRAEVEDQQAGREYIAILTELDAITARTADASRKPYVPAEVSRCLGGIAGKTGMIIERYRQRPRDFTGAASTLLVLHEFDEILAHYLKVTCAGIFLDKDQADRVITNAENHVIPMIDQALETLGRKMDSGEASDKDVHGETLEDMLDGLDLLSSRPGDRPIAARKETPHDTQR